MPHYQRINGSHLNAKKGETVCLVGKLIKQSSDKAFTVTAADDTRVEVKLNVPLRDQLSDIVEVYGRVDAQGNINCDNYTTFDESMIANFDMNLYGETLAMIYQIPKYYAQSGGNNDL